MLSFLFLSAVPDMITLRNISLSRGHKLLLDESYANLYEKQKIGLIGRNGCGKSSFFSLILQELLPDKGECQINQHLRMSHLSQQLPDTHEKALNFVLSGDEQYQRVLHELAHAEKNHLHEQILSCHTRLADMGGYSKPAQAAVIMNGLGFQFKDQQQAVNEFSGGWRMRLNLARCLMKPADLYLLDEPTNHLDMEAIFWLEKWLKQSPASLLIISHDREFLDAITTHTLHIEHQKINIYNGNYSQFEKLRAQQLMLQQQAYIKQQTQISHLMSFVKRFKAKASKAKQAQSRLKMIDKMEIIAQAQLDSPFSFEFPTPQRTTNPLLHAEQIMAGYNDPILKKVNLVINNGDRIAFLGPNGQGKSTLIKTLTGSLTALSGQIKYAAHLKIGYYAQHQLEALDNSLSPLETIQRLTPDAKEQTIRDFLGGFHFIGDAAIHSIKHFSGGEKARLALAKLVWQKPNLLLLDEPTNHLDLDMRSALEIALQSYEGALILVTHDRHLLKTTVDDFYLIYDKKLTPFTGDLEDYHQWLADINQTETLSTPTDATHYREKKTLQNRVKKVEMNINSLQNKIEEIEHQLSDELIYSVENKNKLQQLLDAQKILREQLITAENEWLDLSAKLEEISG